jgi:hypothetical protein
MQHLREALVALLTAHSPPGRSCLTVPLLIASSCCAAHPSEYQLKTVFLLDFAQSVEWPANAFPGPASPFVIGVLGTDPFGPQLDALVRDKAVHRRSVIIERYHNIDELHHCNILFIGQTQPQELPRILAALRGRSVLTVSDADEAEQSGVMIQLFTASHRIRLRIDLAAAQAAKLVISSRLLRLAAS